ncbi:WD40 repeat domain-containing protein [Halocalculus aciditolerans]|uniref:WD40 repeat domain-containing protein n=1 Tax=Halocalculus aciditolerans TaxID=1383812 RepID=A0A830FQ05_9EURY|nr:hypothetical protein [Halocalculus aciditolerans]GGL68993.1 hypothetical protein GCM10009039_28730 [Halocalculus aciditolerans]
MHGRAFRSVAAAVTGEALRDVAAGRGVLAAVGDDGTIVSPRDGEWRVVTHGAYDGDTLYAAAPTDDGRRVWVAGEDGTAGYWDVGNEETHAYAIPSGTADFRSLAVAGPAGREVVWAVDDDGVVHHGTPDGDDWAWERDVPGDGETLYDVVYAPGRPVVTSENGVAYVRGEYGWEDVGIESPDLLAVAVATTDGVFFGSEDAVYVPDGDDWTAYELANDTVMDLATRGDQVLVVTENGRVHAYDESGWREFETDRETSLYAIGGRERIVTVGDDGAILEFTS